MRSDLIKRILIVGLGSIGRRHLRLARTLMPNADIRVLRHKVSTEIPEFANGCFFKAEDAVVFAPQIAVIANPAPFHIEVAQALASSGANLLIEKPLASSLNGVMEFLNTCKLSDTVVLTGYNLRFVQSLIHYRKILTEGVVGKILSVRCDVGQNLTTWRPENDYRNTVSARRELGGGVLLELSHELDFLRWIFGEIDWVKATLSKQSSLQIDVEDTAHLVLGFSPSKDGHSLIASVNLDFIRHDATRTCIAIGELGSLRWNGINGTVDLLRMGDREWSNLFTKLNHQDDSYLMEWHNLINSYLDREVPRVNGNDGFFVLQIIDAARHSAASNGLVIYIKREND